MVKASDTAIEQLPSEDAEKCKYILGLLYNQVENVSNVIKSKSVDLEHAQVSIDDFNGKLKDTVEFIHSLRSNMDHVMYDDADLPLEVIRKIFISICHSV